jgi:protein-disulfide isomerase
MENNKRDLGRWVDARMASLDALGDWQPNPARALSALRRRDRSRRVQRAGWVGATAAAMAAGIVLLTLVGPRACANPVECGNDANQASAPQKTAIVRNFKESGSPAATVTCEIYSDYQCPSCAAAFAAVVPQLTAEYVNTGKVKLLHRDFPLAQHQYSRLAARYANAAGRLGYYDAAVAQIFKTQAAWEKDGAVDRQLTAVLPPGAMQKVREMVANDRSLDDTVAADLTMGALDKINQTPSLVVVAKGKRQVIPGAPSMPLLKSYLDDVLK